MTIRGHLCIGESRLAASAEWMDPSVAWRFVRVSQGAAYWLSSELTRELQVGDVIVAAPSGKGRIRASQLGEVRLHTFHFSPELFSGFLTLPERHYFESIAHRTRPQVLPLPASHPFAEQFGRLVEESPAGGGFFLRCKVLNLLSLLFAEELQRHRPPAARKPSAPQRFKELMEQMTDVEMLRYTPRQLAELCGCSLRHFTRLFREHFGTSPCAKQIDLRLVKARELLASTDQKIIHVAIESGFRNLGLFNAVFKKRLGMTPSEWRQKHWKNGTKAARAALLLLAGLALGVGLLAWTGPPGTNPGGVAPAGGTLVPPPGVATTNVQTLPAPPPSNAGQPVEETREQRLQRIEREIESRQKETAPVGTATATNRLGTVAPPQPSPAPPSEETREQRLQRIEREIEARHQAQQTTNQPPLTNAAPAAATTNLAQPTPPAPGSTGLNRALYTSPAVTKSLALTNRPAASTNAGPVFPVRGYEVSGNTLLQPAILDSIFVKYTGSNATFEAVRAADAELQMAYWDRGYVTVKVGLPPQSLATNNNMVRLEVTEGRLVQINVVNNRYFSSNNVIRALPSLRTNTFPNNLILQQELGRANANRDRSIYPLLGEGPEPGTSIINLRVKDRFPLHGRFELNNNYTPDTPPLRMNFAAQYNNLWEREHQFGLQYGFSPTEMKDPAFIPPQPQPPGPGGTSYPAGGKPPVDIAFYDQPSVANYSAFYRLPLGGVNSPPRQRDPAQADFGYDEVTHRFRAPPPTDSAELLFYASRSSSDPGLLTQFHTNNPPAVPVNGGVQVATDISVQTLTINENLGMRLLQPLPPVLSLRSSFSAGLDFKRYGADSVQSRRDGSTYYVIDHTNQTDQIVYSNYPGPTDVAYQSTSKALDYLPFQINWEGTLPDPYGSTSLSINNSLNFSGLLSGRKEFAALAGTNATGTYYILNAGLSREQRIYRDWGARLHMDGQWATEPLISNEQIGLGGMPGPRGYLDGQEYGDTGWRAVIEPHSPQFNLGLVDGTAPMYVRLSAFVDYGQRYLIDPVLRRGSLSMFGVGGGLTANIGQHFDFRVTIAVPLLDVPGRKAGEWRVAFGIGAQF